jgi:hypothetical protein
LWAIYLCVCVAVLSYEFLKNQFFLMAITWSKVWHRILRPIKTKFNEKKMKEEKKE